MMIANMIIGIVVHIVDVVEQLMPTAVLEGE